MLVRINETWHDGHAGGIDDLGAFRNLNIFHGTHPLDVLPFDHDCIVLFRRRAGGIDENPSLNDNGPRGTERWLLRTQEDGRLLGTENHRQQ